MSQEERPYPTDYNMIAFVFDTKNIAEGVAEDIETQGMLANYHIVAKGVVTKDENGEVQFHGPGRQESKGAVAGFIGGGLLGLIGGPVGFLALAVGGAVVGGLAGHLFHKRSFHTEDMQELGAALQKNNSAFMILAKSEETDQIIITMEGYNARVIVLSVGEELCAEISSAVAAGYGQDDA